MNFPLYTSLKLGTRLLNQYVGYRTIKADWKEKGGKILVFCLNKAFGHEITLIKDKPADIKTAHIAIRILFGVLAVLSILTFVGIVGIVLNALSQSQKNIHSLALSSLQKNSKSWNLKPATKSQNERKSIPQEHPIKKEINSQIFPMVLILDRLSEINFETISKIENIVMSAETQYKKRKIDLSANPKDLLECAEHNLFVSVDLQKDVRSQLKETVKMMETKIKNLIEKFQISIKKHGETLFSQKKNEVLKNINSIIEGKTLSFVKQAQEELKTVQQTIKEKNEQKKLEKEKLLVEQKKLDTQKPEAIAKKVIDNVHELLKPDTGERIRDARGTIVNTLKEYLNQLKEIDLFNSLYKCDSNNVLIKAIRLDYTNNHALIRTIVDYINLKKRPKDFFESYIQEAKKRKINPKQVIEILTFKNNKIQINSLDF